MAVPSFPCRPLLAACALVLALCAAGCGNKDVDRLDMEYVTDGFAIRRIGVCGRDSAAAALEFVDAGYEAVDLGADVMAALEGHGMHGQRFIAVIAGVDVGRSHQYFMKVLDAKTGKALWVGEGPFGNSDGLSQTDQRTTMAVRAMVRDFAGAYPPAGR